MAEASDFITGVFDAGSDYAAEVLALKQRDAKLAQASVGRAPVATAAT